VGSGAAGLYAALCLPSSLKVCLISKTDLKTGASDWAQGGIAAALSPLDSPILHYEDTLKAGVGLCEPEAVEFLVNHAQEAIKALVELGVNFDRHGEELAMTLEAAHSRPRVLHAADRTGRAIVSILAAQVRECPHVTIIPEATALNLLVDPRSEECRGIRLLYQGQIQILRSRAVILATGGGGQVFAQTTNPQVSTGDGVALAWRAGALLRDLEFFQFHPTALQKEGAPHFLISEAVRGEGAHLVDEQGARFAFTYHPAGELAPRDVVSRAIYAHLQKYPQARIYLDLRPIPAAKIQYRFPNIVRICQNWGVEVFSEPIPVAPAAHYWMGGIATNLQSQTSLPYLYALGETASTGVHGANRLASNSLLECIVFAAQLREIELGKAEQGEETENIEIKSDFSEEMAIFANLRQDIPRLLWLSAGIVREEKGLEKAIAQVEQWRQQLLPLSMSQILLDNSHSQTFSLPDTNTQRQLSLGIETLNLLDIAHLILNSANFRQESRGGHYRSDYPHTETAWQGHTMIKGDRWWLETLYS
jgi:L-aspartate oxidase